MKNILFALLLTCFSLPAFAAEKESAHDRVMRTGVLRCAWATGAPWIYKNLGSGVIEGPITDIVREMAASLSLKVEWAAEVGYADFAEGFKAGRYDAFCGILTITPARARVVAFTDPYAYMPLYAYVRTGETRFKSLEDMNRPGIRAGVIDGEVFQALTRKLLPQAEEISLPNMTPQSMLFNELDTKKVDVVFHDPLVKVGYEKNNPGQIATAFPRPIGVNAMGFAIDSRDQALRDTLNIALLSMRDTGKLDDILNGYGLDKTVTYRIPKSYEAPE